MTFAGLRWAFGRIDELVGHAEGVELGRAASMTGISDLEPMMIPTSGVFSEALSMVVPLGLVSTTLQSIAETGEMPAISLLVSRVSACAFTGWSKPWPKGDGPCGYGEIIR